MANILINAFNLSIGGGKNILDNYIKGLSNTELIHNYFFLTPNSSSYFKYGSNKLIIIDIEPIYKFNIFFIGLYFYRFPMLLRKFKIDLIFNFGDIVVPTKVPQIYFFDWAYAVYSEKYIWRNMRLKDYLLRKIKKYLIEKYIDIVKLIIVQSINVSRRFKANFKNDKILVVPTPLGIKEIQGNQIFNLNLKKGVKYFFYPASFSYHKNFEVILKLLFLIKSKKLPFVIILTLDETVASKFLDKINLYYKDNIMNLGKVDLELMPSIYNQVDALLFPSLLETYGFPYIEAMTFDKPILTSNLDFAHAICDDFAFYFDPFDPESILDVMLGFDSNLDDLRERITKGKLKLKSIPEWKDVIIEFNFHINNILRKI